MATQSYLPEYTTVGQIGLNWTLAAIAGKILTDANPDSHLRTRPSVGPRSARAGPLPGGAASIPAGVTIDSVVAKYWLRSATAVRDATPFVSWLNQPTTRVNLAVLNDIPLALTLYSLTFPTAPDGAAWTAEKLFTVFGGAAFGLESVFQTGGGPTPILIRWTDFEVVVTYSFAGPSVVTVVTGPVTELAATTARLTGTVAAGGAIPSNPAVVEFEYGATVAYGTRVVASPGTVSGSAATTVSLLLDSLTSGNTYHYRVRALVGGVDYLGEDRSFTTPIGGNRFFRFSRFNCQAPDGDIGRRDRTRMVSFGFDIASDQDICPPITPPKETT